LTSSPVFWAVLLAGGVGGYFYFTKPKKTKKNANKYNRKWLATLSDIDLRHRLKFWKSHPTGVKGLIKAAELELTARRQIGRQR
jgi:hypothetical protein